MGCCALSCNDSFVCFCFVICCRYIPNTAVRRRLPCRRTECVISEQFLVHCTPILISLVFSQENLPENKRREHMLQIKHLTIHHKKDYRILLEDFNLNINAGNKCALIGEEGNGKAHCSSLSVPLNPQRIMWSMRGKF